MNYTTKKALYFRGRRYEEGQKIELDPKVARRMQHLLVKNSNSLPDSEEENTKKESKNEKAVEGKEDKQVKKAKKK